MSWSSFLTFLVVATLLLAGAVYAVGRWCLNCPQECSQDVREVRGLVGSEKSAFFADATVRAALACAGWHVEATAVGSRQMAALVTTAKAQNDPYDFVFPGGDATLAGIDGLTRHPLWTSPLAVATYKKLKDVLVAQGIATMHTGGHTEFDMARYLAMVRDGPRRWDQLAGATFDQRRDVLVTTTDPRYTNSASLFAALALRVGAGRMVTDPGDLRQALQANREVVQVFARQGALSSRTAKTFEDYLDGSASLQPPLTLIYEAEYLGLSGADRSRVQEPALLYLKPTIVSRHTYGSLSEDGRRLADLLGNDKLRSLAARHGFRDGGGEFRTGGAAAPVPPGVGHVPGYGELQLEEPPPANALDELARAVMQ